MNDQVDTYLLEGCGRCPLGGTPNCKVHLWTEELILLRRVVIDCGLTEELKWGAPCYTFKGNNIAMIAAFKEHCVLSFFKGVLLKDAENLLEKPGENTQSGRIIKFTQSRDVLAQENNLKAYIYEAIEVEKTGLKVEFKKNSEPIPNELLIKLESNDQLKNAWEALTPGRQRGYILHFSQPKQSKTRTSRIEKYIPKICEGLGLHDRNSD